MHQEQFPYTGNADVQQYVGPYRLEKTLGKGQTGTYLDLYVYNFFLSGEMKEIQQITS